MFRNRRNRWVSTQDIVSPLVVAALATCGSVATAVMAYATAVRAVTECGDLPLCLVSGCLMATALGASAIVLGVSAYPAAKQALEGIRDLL